MKTLRIITFTLFCLAIVVLAVVSLLDLLTGQEGTSQTVYQSAPFAAMWGVLAVLSLVYAVRRHLWRVPATMLMHVALSVILLGALVTHLWGEAGRLHVREYGPTQYVVLEDGTITKLPFLVHLDSFEIMYYRGTDIPQDYVSRLRFEDAAAHQAQAADTVTVSMNHIATRQHYRFVQLSYDSDLRGSILQVSHDPWGIGITYTGYGLLLLGMLLYFFQRRSGFAHIRPSLFIRVFIAVLFILPFVIDFRPMMTHIIPVLRSPFFPIHVVAISIAYLLLAYIMVNGLVALVMSRRSQPNMPRIQRMKELSQLMLYPALFLLTFGIFVGAVWANVSWGRYWGWDSKEVWALISMMVYALPLHQQSLRWFARPLHFHAYCALAFLVILMTYFGANYLLVGLHSYV